MSDITNQETKKLTLKEKLHAIKNDPKTKNSASAMIRSSKSFGLGLMQALIIIGICYVILAPIIGIVVKSFMSNSDSYNPMVYLIPTNPTLERYKTVIECVDYFPTMAKDLAYTIALMVIQVFMCSMVGYGFARFSFPGKNILFGCVVLMIVIPSHSIMLPLYMTFRNFNPLGLVKLFNNGNAVNLMGTPIPMFIMTVFACGLRSGLYIYIFNQFFRGLPKEIEEAAFVDGAGVWYTYFRIMLVNAMPSVITVAVFSLVWQYNDTFYANLFQISPDIVLSKKISTLTATIANQYKVLDRSIQQLYLNAGIVLMMIPIVIIYLILQKRFVEGVERSGIVG